MGRIAGRNARIYMAIASGGTAEPLPFLATWSLDANTDKIEVTAFGDANKVYVAGLPDASGEFGGFYDDSTNQTYTAAQDGMPRKFYLYPDATNPSKYWFGTILPDYSASGDVAGATELKAGWSAATPIIKV